jgi:phage baseplate assembly protein W
VQTTQLVLPEMVERRKGRIVNVTSQAGVHRWPLVSAYSVSKAAVVKLTENLARETARYGIGVFSVHPGLLPIGMSESVNALVPTSVHEARVRRWALDELAHGRGADPKQAIELILGTAPGERPMRPEFGCGVHDFVFDSIDASTIGKMENAIRDALDHWEPRVVVETVEFDLSDVDEGRLMIDIGYRIRVTNTIRNLVYPFYVIPAEELE